MQQFLTSSLQLHDVKPEEFVRHLFPSPAFADPFVISPSATASAMVTALLGSGSGITIVPGSATYNSTVNGSSTASGTFTGGTGIIPFDDGVLLTTAVSATAAAGPNNSSGGFTNGTASGSDADLSNLVGGASTFDKAVLEFDFTATGSAVSFQYVFGSEEYDEFVGSQFNDVFAFFLNGVNIAVLPGTSTPVANSLLLMSPTTTGTPVSSSRPAA